MDLCEDILGKLSLGDMAFLELMAACPAPGSERIQCPGRAAGRARHDTKRDCDAHDAGGRSRSDAGRRGSGFAASAACSWAVWRRPRACCRRRCPIRAPVDIEALARALVEDHRTRNRAVPGIGHRFHKPIDRCAPKLFEIAAATDFPANMSR